ncbi:hypothetical protein KI809_12785 [Geobacter pelophilus]|jgi:hypothetical protein|uniref:Uncharacterized protein n=1 Tax=Geoanaerobacter pelophilus TaxID=60036 RepID=A0AAW4L5U6_9BACT|nr:hypothetical protein [Geoanaerobacter pelophilus]MBT0665175.1 hypothetical protein [Geoanaerobacter pelophilus]
MSPKNLYLLGLEESPNRQPDIHEMIRSLKNEISRGEEVYSRDELAILERKLHECQEFLRAMTQT